MHTINIAVVIAMVDSEVMVTALSPFILKLLTCILKSQTLFHIKSGALDYQKPTQQKCVTALIASDCTEYMAGYFLLALGMLCAIYKCR